MKAIKVGTRVKLDGSKAPIPSGEPPTYGVVTEVYDIGAPSGPVSYFVREDGGTEVEVHPAIVSPVE